MTAAAPTASKNGAPGALGAALRDADVEVWTASLDGQPDQVVQYLQSLLSPDECARARKFHFARDRRRFETGRGILRDLLSRYLGTVAREIRFRYGANGKPALAADGGERLFFNLAHADGVAMYAFTRVAEVGVDVERIRPIPEWQPIAAAQFPPVDRARVYAASESERPHEFFRAWTREEARLKATGEGLGSTDPARFAATGFVVHPLAAPAGYLAALALSPAVRWLAEREWPPADAACPPARRTALTTFSDQGTDSP